jgi:hypothetical protein
VVREVDAESQQVTDSYIFARKIKAAADGWRQDFQLKKVVVDLKGTESLVAIKSEPVPALQAPNNWPSRLDQLQILEVIGEAWEQGRPLSLAPQTRTSGRYAPSILHRRLNIESDIVEKLIERWLEDGIVEIGVQKKANRTEINGLKKGSKSLPFSNLAPQQAAGVENERIYQPMQGAGVDMGRGGSDDFG